VQAWQTVDVDANHYIPASRFVPMMMDTPAPFGFKIAGRGPLSRAGILQRLTQLAIPVYVMAVDVNAVERARRRRRRMEARALARRAASGAAKALALADATLPPGMHSALTDAAESKGPGVLSALSGASVIVAHPHSPMASPMLSLSPAATPLGGTPMVTVGGGDAEWMRTPVSPSPSPSHAGGKAKSRRRRRRPRDFFKSKMSQLASMANPPPVRYLVRGLALCTGRCDRVVTCRGPHC
jgi:hypothetical protein